MKLSTGKIAFPIEFDNGDIQNIYFNPSDPELASRLITTKDRINERLKDLKFDDYELSNSGEPVVIESLEDTRNLTTEQMEALTVSAEEAAKIVSETRRIICEELNTAFDSDVSTVVFKYCSPFAIVDGNYFVLNFLEAIAPEIKKCVESANKDVEKKMQKHIGKYQK